MGEGMCAETVADDVAELKRDSVRGPLLCVDTELNRCTKRSPGCTGCLYFSCNAPHTSPHLYVLFKTVSSPIRTTIPEFT